MAASLQRSLSWALKPRMPSKEDEMSIASVLVKSAQEAGRGIDLPDARKEEITVAAEQFGFLLSGAMSFRRQLIRQALKSDSRYWSSTMQMGNPADANKYAAMFEELVAVFLRSAGIEFVTEQTLKRARSPNTPDFYVPAGCVINDRLVYWIDCKTYYGAATIARDSSQPVGKLRATSLRYTLQFGPG